MLSIILCEVHPSGELYKIRSQTLCHQSDDHSTWCGPQENHSL